jgi:hypothetical protein
MGCRSGGNGRKTHVGFPILLRKVGLMHEVTGQICDPYLSPAVMERYRTLVQGLPCDAPRCLDAGQTLQRPKLVRWVAAWKRGALLADTAHCQRSPRFSTADDGEPGKVAVVCNELSSEASNSLETAVSGIVTARAFGVAMLCVRA